MQTKEVPSMSWTQFKTRALRRKSIEQVQEDFDTSELHRTLGPLQLVFIGIGCIIGAGIFVRTGNAAALHAGPAVLLSFVVAGVVCALAGLCYAELASALPVSGSAYTYAYVALGDLAAWFMGALLLLEYGLAGSVVAVGWSGYVTSLLADFSIVLPAILTAPTGAVVMEGGEQTIALVNLPAVLVVVLLTGLLVLGISASAHVNNIIVVIKLVVVVAFIVIGALIILQEPGRYTGNWDPFIPPPGPDRGEFGVDGIMRAASIVFFAYIGFEAVSTAGQEARDPKRSLPIGILGSLVICTLLYMLVAAVMTLIVPYTELDVPDPVAVAVDSFGAGWGWFAMAVKIGAIIGLTSVILILMYGQTRIFYAMSRDGLLPAVFARVHPRLRTPHINTLLVGLVVGIAAGVFDINTLGDLTSVGTLAAFMVVCGTVIYLRHERKDMERSFSVPFYPFVPIAGILSCAYLIWTVELRVLEFFGWYVLGAALFWGARSYRRTPVADAG